jgi:D-beta-D-heptose 7-phosphate kinase/D-beta-D-heptose 1-phosphate adenosyltransferase
VITPLPELVAERERWRAAAEPVAFANGCFDLLHVGHLQLLEAARAGARRVIVAINSDASVAALKGSSRPVVPAHERAELLLALEAVDRVTAYDEPTPLALIRALRPDVLVKGADWELDQIVGRREVEADGGRVLRVPLLPGRSTSRLVDRLRRP